MVGAWEEEGGGYYYYVMKMKLMTGTVFPQFMCPTTGMYFMCPTIYVPDNRYVTASRDSPFAPFPGPSSQKSQWGGAGFA